MALGSNTADGIARLLYLETLHGFIFTVILEATRTAWAESVSPTGRRRARAPLESSYDALHIVYRLIARTLGNHDGRLNISFLTPNIASKSRFVLWMISIEAEP